MQEIRPRFFCDFIFQVFVFFIMKKGGNATDNHTYRHHFFPSQRFLHMWVESTKRRDIYVIFASRQGTFCSFTFSFLFRRNDISGGPCRGASIGVSPPRRAHKKKKGGKRGKQREKRKRGEK